jgi:hypothetical protein
MLRYARYPDDLFVGAPTTLQLLRQAIQQAHGQ